MHENLPPKTFIKRLRCYIKGAAKQATDLVKVQSVLCEDTVRLKRVIVVRRFVE